MNSRKSAKYCGVESARPVDVGTNIDIFIRKSSVYSTAKHTEINNILTITVLRLQGYSEICAYVRSNLCDLICLRHSRAVKNRIFSPKRLIFLHECTTCSKLPCNISTMGQVETDLVRFAIFHAYPCARNFW